MNPMGMGGPAEAPFYSLRLFHFVGHNLSLRVTEYMLTEIFAVAGPVQHVKIIPDRNYQHGGLNYGFVEYIDMRAAETALQTLNGRKIFDTEIRVNWAYQGQQNKEDTTGHYHVFVGDLSPEVNDDVLAKAFSAFGTMSDARVMWDMNSGKSRGYGFLAFRDKTDAEQAIATMNGEWLGSRAIRVNWANQKTQGAPAGQPVASPRPGAAVSGGAPAPINFQGGPLSYESVVQQTPSYNTTVYVGNLVPYCTQADLIPLFQSIGYLSEIRMQADRGFAFVKLDTHEHAAMAIVQLQGQMVHGRPIKCSWGKDRADGGAVQPGAPMTPTAAPAAYGQMPLYGMPQPSSYGQYGFGAYGAFPAQGTAAPGGAGPGSPGMPQPAGGAAAGLGITAGAQQPGADPNAAAAAAAAGQAGQPQWGAADPSYYSNYWGGYYGQAGQQSAGGDAQMQGPA
ncbi:Nucleolysin TIAR [Termitomyces sp. J132]|nr:Nucleolysin TIAR [Termitomyces sp. J132]